MSKQTDIIISGGGVAGLCLALLCAQQGLKIAVIEPYPPKSAEITSRTVALMNSSLNIIKAVDGLWPKIESIATPMEQMRIIDISRAVKEPLRVEFPAHEIGLEQFGCNIPNVPLRYHLYELAKAHNNIEIYTGALSTYESDLHHAKVSLEDGSVLTAKLLVGADGRSSKVRLDAGVEVERFDYDQIAITCIINHSLAHENTSTEFHKPYGPLALVPLSDGHQSSVVWVENKERAEAILRMKKSEFEQALNDKSQGLLGAITLETGLESWPLSTMRAKRYVGERCALIAETLHVMSPVTAQGLNLSLRDVAALAEVLIDQARLGLDIGSDTCLKAYEKRRRLDINSRVMGVDHMNRAVSSQNKIVKDMRRIGLRTLETIPALKHFAMHVGLAPQMDQGRLMRGEGL
ncbi:MAG: ubiquinone biosynthesis protein [Micavibrio sp.]|nr:ubiquinone biosynthesis protein [Micavibrio sp.]